MFCRWIFVDWPKAIQAVPNSILQDRLQEIQLKTRNSLNPAEKVLKRRAASGNATANTISDLEQLKKRKQYYDFHT